MNSEKSKAKKKFIVQVKIVTIHSASVEASSVKDAREKFLAGKAEVFDTCDLEKEFVSVIREQ